MQSLNTPLPLLLLFHVSVWYFFRKARERQVVSSIGTPNILSASTFRSFWISWNNATIALGRGTIVGQNVVLEYVDSAYNQVNFIAVSSWNEPGVVFVNYGAFSLTLYYLYVFL